MDLISDTVEISDLPGPKYPPIYLEPPSVALWDPLAFRSGPPLEAFRALREGAPVAWCEEPAGRPGFWAVTRYADVARVGSDPETFSSQKGGILMAHERSQHPLSRASLNALINMDAPWHFSLRREHMPYFTPAYLRALSVKIDAEADRLIDAMAGKGRCDLVSELSAELPLFTLCEILGVPVADRPKFLTWMHFLEMANAFFAERSGAGAPDLAAPPPPELKAFLDAFEAAIAEMFAYGRTMLHKRRLDPQDDLMSAIARAELDGEPLPDDYLDGSWLLIVFAGNDTTRNTISGAMALLSAFPEERARLQASPDLFPNAVNEFIRLISPVMYMRRTAVRDAEIGGQRIGAGEKVVMFYGSANRDEAMFADPDRLDVGRANAERHLAFGYGPHVCIGKRVAALQLEAVYRRLLQRLPDIHQDGPLRIAANNFVYAIQSLPVAFTPAPR